ncbi:MAG: thiamine pyrophosphate-dependent dehydrogenase E1 component subunit alpha [Planctomycetota bacterium]|nr:thiamine pyrophosphate-dependent dehydrogenase E1 component subunit alpha [Planctomycetota bacterium]
MLTREDKLAIYTWMLLTRAVDDRCHTLFKQGKLPGSVFSQLGHEAIAVGAAYALEEGDVVAPMHRDLGAQLVRGMSPGRIFAQHMGRIGAPSRGRDVNTHGLGDMSLRILGYVSHLPQLMPVALGAAFAFQYREEKNVALSYFGDGSSSEGGCHETLNLASVFRAPIVFILENNQYAYSTPTRYQYAIENLADRAASYGFPGLVVDGNDVLEVWKSTKEAVDRARDGGGPTLIECKTMRMRGHAVHDPADYVPREILEEWAAKDPLDRYAARLRDEGLLDGPTEKEVRDRVQREVDEGVRWAEASPWPDAGSVTEGVFA